MAQTKKLTCEFLFGVSLVRLILNTSLKYIKKIELQIRFWIRLDLYSNKNIELWISFKFA